MRSLIIILSLLLLFSSCTKVLINEEPENDPITNFETLWNNTNEKYSFFTSKNINWDSIGDANRALINESTSDTALFRILANMLYELEDGHVNLSSSFDVSRNWSWYLDHPINFNYEIIQRNYLTENHMISGGFRHRALNDSIAYVYYGSFMSWVNQENFGFILDKYKNHKALILDVRDNGGGIVFNAQRMVSFFIDEEVLGYNEYIKAGPGHDEFYGPNEIMVEPADSNQFLNKPVIVLTNRSCYSATSLFVAMMYGLPNVTIIGDRTGGGGGMPSDYDLPNGWTYRISTTISTDRNGYSIEFGTPPNYSASSTLEDAANNRDGIIDTAVMYINSVL